MTLSTMGPHHNVIVGMGRLLAVEESLPKTLVDFTTNVQLTGSILNLSYGAMNTKTTLQHPKSKILCVKHQRRERSPHLKQYQAFPPGHSLYQNLRHVSL